MYGCFAMCLCIGIVKCLQRPEEGTGPPEPELIAVSHSVGPVKEQQVPLTAKPALQPVFYCFLFVFKIYFFSQVVMVHTFNPSTWEAEADGSLRVHDQPGL